MGSGKGSCHPGPSSKMQCKNSIIGSSCGKSVKTKLFKGQVVDFGQCRDKL